MATVLSITSAYLKFLERQKNSPDHVANTRRDLDRFAKFVGEDKDVEDCKQHDLSDWLADNPQWKSVNTRKNAVSAVIGCFRWAEEEERIDRCPYRRPRALRGSVAKPRRPATEEEYLKLRRGGSPSLRAALFFLRQTGARTCEMREALWADITDGDRPCIALFKHKTARKTGQCRIVALNRRILRVLMLMKKRAVSLYIFTNCHGGPWTRHTFAHHLRRTAVRLGMDAELAEGIDRVSGYCLRHTFTCAGLKLGLTSKDMADLLGHTSTTMVERVYGSHTARDIEHLTRKADKISDASRERRRA